MYIILFAVSLHTNFSADSGHVKLCPSHSSIALYAIVWTMTLLLPDGPPLSQIVDLIASILSLRFSILEIQNLCEMRSCLNAHESQYLSRVFLSRQPVANISLQWTFSRTKLIWLALFGKGHRLSAKGYGVTLKAAVSSLHPSTFLARKWNLADALCSCAHRLTGSHRIAKAAWLKIFHSVVATVTIIFGEFQWMSSVSVLVGIGLLSTTTTDIGFSMFQSSCWFSCWHMFTPFMVEAKCPTQATALECFGSQWATSPPAPWPIAFLWVHCFRAKNATTREI